MSPSINADFHATTECFCLAVTPLVSVFSFSGESNLNISLHVWRMIWEFGAGTASYGNQGCLQILAKAYKKHNAWEGLFFCFVFVFLQKSFSEIICENQNVA